MTWLQYLMLAAAVLSALAWRWNATSAALAFSYFVTQFWWLIAGEGLDVGELFMIDIMTIALVFCKAIARCPDIEFESGWDQLRCFLTSPTRRDWIVLGCFPLMWLAYVALIDEFTRWHLLWALAMVQFAAAGSEAFTEWRRCRAPREEPDNPSSGLQFAAAGNERWST